MKGHISKMGICNEAIYWLESLGYGQAMHVLMVVDKIMKFAGKKADFFQDCGLYAVGSSLTRGGKYNDVDLVLVGLDFRAVVSYDKIFLMDPKTLIEKGVLVEPECFVVIQDDGEASLLKPATDPNTSGSIEAFSRMGMEYKGKRYDYNIRELLDQSLTLEGFCSNHGRPSGLVKGIYKLFHSREYLSDPFDNYSLGGVQDFLVFRFPIDGSEDSNLSCKPGDLIKPIDVCVHAENLYRGAWMEHQRYLGLRYVPLIEWPQTTSKRKVVTELDYPRFIDPLGKRRARWDPMFTCSFHPGNVIGDIIDV